MRRILPLVAGSVLASGGTGAQTPAPRLEVTANRHAVSDGYGDWSGVALRGLIPVGARDVWGMEITKQRGFHDDGSYLGVWITHDFSPTTFGHTSLGTSAGGAFYPAFRVAASVHRKLGSRRNVVGSLGASFNDAKDEHRDYGGQAGLAYYFTEPLVIELNGTVNRSDPGGVVTGYATFAATAGRERSRYAVLRIAAGREGYQLLGGGTTLVKFASRSAHVSLREWLTPGFGAIAGADFYTNPFYRRAGITVGAFADF